MYSDWVREVPIPGDIPVTNGMSLAAAKKKGVELAATMTKAGHGSTHYVYVAPLGPAKRNWSVFVHDRSKD